MKGGKVYLDFEICKKYAQHSGIKTRREWQEIASKGYLPDGIPKDPAFVFSREQKQLIPLDVLKHKVKKYNIKSQSEYKKAKASGRLPKELPGVKTLYVNYKDRGWKGFGDFLGTGRIADREKRKLVFKDFKKCRSYIRKKKFENTERWYEFAKSPDKPEWIPTHPDRCFKDEWISFSDWIGRQNKFNKWSYTKSKEWIKNSKIKIKNRKQFEKLRSQGKIPLEIPASPSAFYRSLN